MKIKLEFKKEDCWIGWFWKKIDSKYHIWIILPPFGFPMIPIHIIW